MLSELAYSLFVLF